MANIPRWLLLAAAIIAILAAAVWAATPPPVVMPAAQLWARCFEPIALPVPAEAAELALLRQKDLENDGKEPPVLLTELAQAADVLLNKDEQASFAGTLPAGQEIALPAGVTWPAWLDKGRLELRRADGSRFLVEARARRSCSAPSGAA